VGARPTRRFAPGGSSRSSHGGTKWLKPSISVRERRSRGHLVRQRLHQRTRPAQDRPHQRDQVVRFAADINRDTVASSCLRLPADPDISTKRRDASGRQGSSWTIGCELRVACAADIAERIRMLELVGRVGRAADVRRSQALSNGLPLIKKRAEPQRADPAQATGARGRQPT